MGKKKKRRSTKKASRPPLVASLLVTCDSLSRDPNIGKVTLYGLFDIIRSETFPFASPSFVLYVQLIGGGEYPIAIVLRKPDGSDVKLGDTTIKCKPKTHTSFNVSLTGLPFDKPGEYQLAVTSRGRDVCRPKTLYIKRSPKKKMK